MEAKNILIYPNKKLRAKNRDLSVEEIKSGQIKKLVEQMINLMYKANGVGLAAPQTGNNLRFSVVDAQDGYGPRVFFNPKIIKTSYRKETNEEGCLSFPGLYGYIKRPRLITIEYVNVEGKKQILKAPAFLSRILQHEIDHLDTVLMIDHTDNFTSGQDLLEQWEKGEKPTLSINYPYSY